MSKLRSNSTTSTPSDIPNKRTRNISSSSTKTPLSTSSNSPNKLSVDIKTTDNLSIDKFLTLINKLTERFDNFEKSFEDKLIDLEKKIESIINNKLVEVKSSLELKFREYSSKFDAKILSISNRLTDLENNHKNYTNLEGSLDIVTAEQDHTNIRVLELERLHHLNDLVINGLDFDINENLEESFKKIAKVINYTDLDSVGSIFRLHGPKSIAVVKFNNFSAKDLFFSKYLRFRNLSNSHIGHNSNSRIYINESLPRHTRFLLRLANKLKKDNWLSKVYTRKGYLFVVKHEGESPLKITSKSDLIQSSNQNKSILLNNSSFGQLNSAT